MNKNELITAVAENAEITKKDAEKTLSAILEIITDSLVNDEEVKITGLGTFKVAERAARNGVNPQTGETIKIPAKKAPTFKASSVLKQAVKES